MFTEMLDRVLNETDGAISVTLMGFDGIAIETRERDAAEVNHQAAAIEYGALASQLRGISESIGTGAMQELTVQTGQLTSILRPLTSEYFVMLAMKPEGNLGKGRYLLRIISPTLQKELG